MFDFSTFWRTQGGIKFRSGIDKFLKQLYTSTKQQKQNNKNKNNSNNNMYNNKTTTQTLTLCGEVFLFNFFVRFEQEFFVLKKLKSSYKIQFQSALVDCLDSVRGPRQRKHCQRKHRQHKPRQREPRNGKDEYLNN